MLLNQRKMTSLRNKKRHLVLLPVMPHVLHVFVVVQHIQEFIHVLYVVLIGHGDVILGYHLNLGGIIVIMGITSPVTGWMYKVAPDGSFERGTYQAFAALYLVAGFIALIIINFKKYKNCEAEDIVRMIFLFSLEAIAIVLQLFEAEMFQDGFIGSADRILPN